MEREQPSSSLVEPDKPSETPPVEPKRGGLLAWIERVGNKIPHPFYLFVWLSLFVVILSFILSLTTKGVVNPTTGKEVLIKNLLSKEGLAYMLTSVVPNFTGFAPLGLVLTMALGIGLAEDTGLIQALMKKIASKANETVLIFVIAVIGVCANIASDAGQVIVPAIAGTMFYALGKNPLVGIALGYAAATAGFTANLFPAGTDALLAGITNEAVKSVNAQPINILANYFFMVVSTFFVAIVLTWITKKIIEPRLGPYKPRPGKEINLTNAELTDNEKKGLRVAGLYLLIYLILIIVIAAWPGSFLRNPKTGSLVENAPLFQGIIPILLILFLITAIPFGKRVGVIKKSSDVPDLMTKSIAKMSGFVALAFIMGQFIAYFNWTNMGLYLAINGANFLKGLGFVGIPLFVAFILITFFLDLFLGSGSAKWAIMAPIFVPMFYLMGYSPAWTQLIYRIGDSPANAMTPLSAYLVMVIGFMREYDENAGVGTALSLMTPYALITLVGWIVFMVAWYLLGIPIGIGGAIHI